MKETVIIFLVSLVVCLGLTTTLLMNHAYKTGFEAATQFDCGDVKFYYNLYHNDPAAVEALNAHMDVLSCPKDRLYHDHD